MRKKYKLLNSSFEIDGPDFLFDFLDKDLVLFPTYSKKIREYNISYIFDQELYRDILNDLKNQTGEKVRFWGNEYKTKIDNKDIIFIIDDNSVIVHTDEKFMIIGKTDYSKNQVLHLICEAIYEGFLLDNDPLLKGAAFAANHENGNIIIGATENDQNLFLMESLFGLPSAYISNDLVGVHNNRALGSIIPIYLSENILTKYNQQGDLKEKNIYSLPDFLNNYHLKSDSYVDIKNIFLPHYYPKGSFYINKIDKKEAKKIVGKHCLNFGDSLRPYLWVNEVNLNSLNRKHFEAKLNNLVTNAECFSVEFGANISQEDIKTMQKAMKL